jgi:hypothetical protein
MSDQPITVQLEISQEVTQQDVWDLEKRLKQVSGVTTELREPKDFITPIHLLIQIAGPYVVQAVAVAAGINTFHELTQTIYAFLHPQKTDQQRGKNKVVIIKKGKRIELYNLTSEEIEKIIKE